MLVEQAKRKYEKREKENSEIIQAAINVFSIRGYDDGTMAMVAKEVGISEAMLYKHFDGKKKLFLTCFDYIISTLMCRYEKCYKKNLDNPLAYLEDCSIEYSRYLNESINGSKFLVHVFSKLSDEDLKKPFISFIEGAVTTINKTLDIAQERGNISKKVNTELITWEYVGHYYTIMLAKEIGSSILLDESNVRSMIRNIWKQC